MDAIQTLLNDYDETVQAIAWKLRELVVDIMPEANEVVTGHKNIRYSTDAGPMKGGMVYIAPFKDAVNLGFMDGVDLLDDEGLLQGTGKRLRHIKLQSLESVTQHEVALRALLQRAKALKTTE